MCHVHAQVPERAPAPAPTARPSRPEQVARVHSADVLIGVHGAGLANIVFAPIPCAALVQLLPPQMCRRAEKQFIYQALAERAAGAAYAVVPHSLTAECPQKWKHLREFEVDVDAVVQQVQAAWAAVRARPECQACPG